MGLRFPTLTKSLLNNCDIMFGIIALADCLGPYVLKIRATRMSTLEGATITVAKENG